MHIIDDFLSPEAFDFLERTILNCQDKEFPFYLQKGVANPGEKTEHWSWMGTHMIYHQREPKSPFYDLINNLFLDKIEMISLLRIKANFYPWTSEVKTHPFHVDYSFENKGALFSINTCDGYTMFEDGTKIDSVANRMMFFNPQVKHCSSTTSNSHGRYNINFNFV